MRKGFTLIEMIATVVILSIISIVIVLGISSVKEKENQKEWNKTVNRITSAADVYLEKNSEIKQEIYNTGIVKYIPITDIVTLGLLDETKLIDPVEDEMISQKTDEYKKVKVFLNDENALEIEYPIKKKKYIVFDSKTIYASVGEEIDCLKGVTIYDENNNKSSTDVISNIKEKNNVYKVVNNKITFTAMGEYELIYYIGESSYLRKVKVLKIEDAYYTTAGEYAHLIEASGTYKITVSGAQGTGGGGKGGTVIGEIALTKGTVLNLVVGGQGAKYGGGTGESIGGDSSRVSLNGIFIIIGAGGGGGINATAGGSGNGAGGANQGKGAGTAGANGSGGGASYTYKYDCNCKTCGGGCKTTACKTCTYDYQSTCPTDTCKNFTAWSKKQCWSEWANAGWSDTYVKVTCSLKTATSRDHYTCCSYYRDCNEYKTKTCTKQKTAANCDECGKKCTSYYDTYSCECETCTKKSLPGNGGLSSGSGLLSYTKTDGDNIGIGKIIIEFLR